MAQNQAQRRSIAALLSSQKSEVIRHWEALVHSQAEPWIRLEKLALQNSFPNMLEHLVGALEPDRRPYQATERSAHHGRLRAAVRGYSLAQVLLEFNLLRQAIFDVLEAREALPSHERDVILGAIEHELLDAVTAFTEARAAEGQSELERSEIAARGLQSRVRTLEQDRDRQGRFVASLSHDLRNPLGAALMAAEILTAQVDQDPETQEIGVMLMRNLARSQRMLCDLLDVGRLSAGHALTLRPEMTDLAQLTPDLVRDLAAVYGDRFEVRASGSLSGVWDRELIFRALENLCTNAIKYGDKDAPVIVQFEGSDGQLSVSVHNEGRVIPLADQERLFDPFTRSSGAAKSGVEGWGLGLALVKAVAEAHGGRVRVVSTAAAGTTFTMTLPVSKPDGPQAVTDGRRR